MIVDKLCFNSQINSETTEGSIHNKNSVTIHHSIQKATPVTTTKKIHKLYLETKLTIIHNIIVVTTFCSIHIISSATNFGLTQTFLLETRHFLVHKYFKHQYLVQIAADYSNKYYLTHKPEVATILLLIQTLASATTAY